PVFLPGVLHDIAVRIDQESLWIFEDLIQVGDLVARIQESRQRKIVVLIELVYFFPIVVDADGHHLKFSIFELLIERLHLRHFFDTWLAPCSPHVQKDPFSPVVAQFNGMSLLILDAEVRRLLADIDDSRRAYSTDLPVHKEPSHRTNNQKKDDGFQPLAHIGHCSISATHELTLPSSRASGTAPCPRRTSWK